MRLKQIKLAGFKSFVDPTKVPFVQQMTAIVGPNGCGKSNIIDAVRWVLGESSAKNLRGDAMTDVIFNGAASRKPIGQASVELIFEHSDNPISPSLSQHLADRNEISIRRVVNRESTNTYFLNGSKCRRKDITDIFLGTGLGPRSYAIIEQGTITRLIESKPQELRVFIEEAAGISKYKERRRDTENRIKHTRENLERLSDIRFELGQQIEKLDQQAQAAKRFRTLKAQERKYKAELAVLKSQKYQQQADAEQSAIDKLKQKIELLVVEQISCENQIHQIKTANSTQTDKLEKLQAKKVDSASHCVRLEQNIKHAKGRLQVVSQEQEKLKHQFQQLNEQLKKDNVSQQQHEQIIESKSPLLAQEEQALLVLQQEIDTLKASNGQLQQQLKKQSQQAQTLLIERTGLESKITHQKQLVQTLTEQHQKLVEQASNKEHIQLKLLIEQEIEFIAQLKASKQSLVADAEQQASSLAQLKQNYSQTKQTLSEQKWQLESLSDQRARQTQELAQSHHSKDEQVELESWLTAMNVTVERMLYQDIIVEEKWRESVEKVLGNVLNAKVTTDKLDLLTVPEGIEHCNLIVKANKPQPVVEDSLASVIEGVAYYPSLLAHLNNIKITDSFEQVMQIKRQLNDEQSVICPNKLWLSNSFFQFGSWSNTNNVLVKQAKLASIEHMIITSQQNLAVLSEQCKSDEQRLNQASEQVAAKQLKQQNLQQQLQQAEQALALNEQSYNHKLLLVEQTQVQIAQQHESLSQAQETLESLLHQFEALASNEQFDMSQLEVQAQQSNDSLAAKQQTLIDKQQACHQITLAIETARTSQQSTQLHQSRLEEQIHHLESQLQSLGFEEENLKSPIIDDQKALEIAQNTLFELENELIELHKTQAGQTEQVDKLEQQKTSIFNQVERHKTTLNKHHIHLQNYQLRAETALEAIAEYQSIKQVIAQMPAEAKETLWQANLTRIAKDIDALGAINLAAIEEFDAQVSRKQYLDQQDEDLNDALKTLESAIAKIDKESRAKFKMTFEQVNHDLQQLFPKVFGGGSAYLALTGDDLLETGVTIMARPPGKKNSTIHLLSGGEKALTALSLVFAIFRLNPAPFCMLDEVDAPLDDANVGRFCNLVREMSQTVQFIYISHNKIAMEMASQLTGVTMYEPGVSRMVAVDIDEAVAMAELS
ncbi:chromosome segregation protein SMC [Thalassotalea eurytherma]|uniref:Chromosome partition protein Smc n=1 Tax=Thalassotalea eurytherma TaxID=1144278 RepID=A0ABQ6H3E2_9GAMM|nr:chromosome segregation protein SMC [Thalassotalea eurytherma]GLX82617.1 chromosome partition protein Smc [Thalassotalea eurytherma]